MKSRQNEAVMPLRSAPEKTLCGCENFHVEFFCVFGRGTRGGKNGYLPPGRVLFKLNQGKKFEDKL